MNGRFIINRSRAKVMGVCAGLADWLNVDVLIVRLGVVAATLMCRDGEVVEPRLRALLGQSARAPTAEPLPLAG